jgi:uncharacterized protein YkwD
MALATRPKQPVHTKKRRAQHHRQSKDYLKHYWPYLPMLLFVVVGLAINSLWASHSGVLGATSDFSSQTLLAGTNAQRAGSHESALALDRQLTTAAVAKATDMAAKNYWSHNAPDGKTPWTFIQASGYAYTVAGENLAYGFNDASSTITGWMNSVEHRANILNANYTQVGFGIATSPNFQGHGPTTIVVAEYGKPADAVANITFTVPDQSGTVSSQVLGSSVTAQPPSRLVGRIQLLTGGKAPWSLFALTIVSGGAVLLFLTRHGLKLRKLITEGEAYVVHHPAFDALIVVLITVGYVLTRGSGFIR